jgi:hypothetical protein
MNTRAVTVVHEEEPGTIMRYIRYIIGLFRANDALVRQIDLPTGELAVSQSFFYLQTSILCGTFLCDAFLGRYTNAGWFFPTSSSSVFFNPFVHKLFFNTETLYIKGYAAAGIMVLVAGVHQCAYRTSADKVIKLLGTCEKFVILEKIVDFDDDEDPQLKYLLQFS